MIGIFALTVSAIGLIALAFIFRAPAIAVTLTAIACLSLAPIFQGAAGEPANADGRLHAESWRLLAVAPLSDNRFIVSVRYAAGDVRTYDLRLDSPGARDAFLKAAADLKKGKAMQGHAAHGRAGMESDDLGFAFSEAPELEPKEGQHP